MVGPYANLRQPNGLRLRCERPLARRKELRIGEALVKRQAIETHWACQTE